jgi:peptide-methionine (S)-S-oxide reductase
MATWFHNTETVNMRMNKSSIIMALAVAAVWLQASVRANETENANSANEQPASRPAEAQAPETLRLEQATFGLGCYSCAEAIFERLKGVRSVVVGYSGGSLKNPTDEQVGSGLSGHAEVVQVAYDPNIISYAELLDVFWKMHDPTTLNLQGKNVGTQYRSMIFYHTDEQRQLAEHYKEKLDASHAFVAPIVTEITAFKEFYPAAKAHQGFFRLNPNDEYCTLVIRPKVEEFEKVFAEKVQTLPVATTPTP